MSATAGYAKTWDLNSVVQKADPEETQDLLKILNDIEFVLSKSWEIGK